MSGIHASTMERARKHGVMLRELPDDHEHGFEAHWPKMNQRMTGDSPKLLLDDMLALIDVRTHYRSFVVEPNVDLSNGPGFRVTVRDYNISVEAYRLADAVYVAKQAWLEARETLTEEELDDLDNREAPQQNRDTKSVVASKFRAKYADLGHATHCGDWLATTINNMVVNKKGTNIDLFILICAANGVDLSKYKREGNGWQGRIRMTGRNLLARKVYAAGRLEMPEQLGGEPLVAPEDWVADQRFVKEDVK